MKKLRALLKRKKGFVMIDAVVGVVILAIGLAALAMLYTNGMGTMHKSGTREKAAQIAADWMEVIKTYADKNKTTLTYDELNTYINSTLSSDKNNSVTTTTDNEKFTVTAEILDDNYDTYFANSKRTGDQYLVPVSVKVSWTSPSAETCTLLTYISLNYPI